MGGFRLKILKFELLAVMTSMFLIGLIVGVSVNLNQTEEFGYVLIDPNEEENSVYQILIGGYTTMNLSYFIQALYTLPSPEYTFSERALHIGLFTYESVTGKIIPHPNITVNSISIQIINENYFIELKGFNFFGTKVTFKLNQRLLNCTIQPITFYKWGVLD